MIDNANFQKYFLGGIPGGKVDNETVAALREMSESNYWWSRLFVAEIMVQNKEFRSQGIIDRLKTNDHELVRTSIASLETPAPFAPLPSIGDPRVPRRGGTGLASVKIVRQDAQNRTRFSRAPSG